MIISFSGGGFVVIIFLIIAGQNSKPRAILLTTEADLTELGKKQMGLMPW